MFKVTALVGSARKGVTYRATQHFLANLGRSDDVAGGIVFLSDYCIEPCVGCKKCFDKGETSCPLKDDRDVLIGRLMESDGVVFASPVYAYQVSGLMKTFLDRIAFLLHRPCFLGKTCTSLVVQGIYGGRSVVKYLDFVAGGLGFHVVRGSCLTTLEPVSDKAWQKMERTLAQHSRRFSARLRKPADSPPSLFRLMAFRTARTSIRQMLDDESYDYSSYAEKGWFTTDYYYPTSLGFAKRVVGRFSDWLGRVVQ